MRAHELHVGASAILSQLIFSECESHICHFRLWMYYIIKCYLLNECKYSAQGQKLQIYNKHSVILSHPFCPFPKVRVILLWKLVNFIIFNWWETSSAKNVLTPTLKTRHMAPMNSSSKTTASSLSFKKESMGIKALKMMLVGNWNWEQK